MTQRGFVLGIHSQIVFWVFTVCIGLAVPAGVAAQPANDTCAGAITVECGDTVTGDTSTANSETLGSCGTADGSGGAVWYRFVGTGDDVTATTCNPGSDYDTKLRVYTDGCGTLTCVTGNDDDSSCSFSGLRSTVQWNADVGVEYLILVHGFGTSEGNYELSISCSTPPPGGGNDDCIDATPITAGSYSGTTTGNNNDGDVGCGAGSGSPSVWFSYTATEDTGLNIDTCDAGTNYDSVLSVHTGCPGTTGNQLACNDDSCDLQSGIFGLFVAENETVYIRVAGFNGSAGDFVLNVDEFDPGSVMGPDVVYTDCQSITHWGDLGGIHGYSLGSFTCNIGDQNLQWGGTTPLLAMNAYRLMDGRLEQIGMSWVKNGTGAAAGSGCGLPCNGQGGGVLGAGCLDVYGSSFNGGHFVLGPRSDVNAFDGTYPGQSSGGSSVIDERLQIHETDLGLPGAIYFVEGVYVAPDDAAAGNAMNNASYKRVDVEVDFDLDVEGTQQIGIPAIQAWQDHGLGVDAPDFSVELTTADIPGEGRFHVAHKVTDLGGGTWRYDYAVFNLNSHVSGGSYHVPVPSTVNITNIGFNDVDYHTGEPYDNTDWGVIVDSSGVTWSSPETFAQNPDSNALRFGTMYNFWFDADTAPELANATIGLFRPFTPSSIDVQVSVPSDGVVVEYLRGDCNEDGVFTLADALDLLDYLFPQSQPGPTLGCDDACDINDDGEHDLSDPITALDIMFVSGGMPPAPFPGCGTDPTMDALGCDAHAGCP